jgi:hypothetical protein
MSDPSMEKISLRSYYPDQHSNSSYSGEIESPGTEDKCAKIDIGYHSQSEWCLDDLAHDNILLRLYSNVREGDCIHLAYYRDTDSDY